MNPSRWILQPGKPARAGAMGIVEFVTRADGTALPGARKRPRPEHPQSIRCLED
jgi:hypothetical protein